MEKTWRSLDAKQRVQSTSDERIEPMPTMSDSRRKRIIARQRKLDNDKRRVAKAAKRRRNTAKAA